MSMKRIGHITPSSNTWLEPLTYAMNEPFTGRLTHHFSRIRVTHLALETASDAQFRLDTMLNGARLLADAPLDGIVWNGTSASWRGLENDVALCEAITGETGIAASTSTIAFYRAFRTFGWQKIALAVPYTEDIAADIATEYGRQGFSITGTACLGIRENVGIGAASPDEIRDVLRRAAKSRPDCIAVVCTNFNATALVAEMEAELGIPIADSIAVTFWEALRLAGMEEPVEGWGRLLASPATAVAA